MRFLKMDIFKMSKIEKLNLVSKKYFEKRLVTIMLSFSKLDGISCDDKNIYIL